MKRHRWTILFGILAFLSILPVIAQDDHMHGVDLTRLPLGDGRVTTTAPQVGYVFACSDRFGGGGAHQVGEWIRDDGTFDLTAKAVVDGEIAWPSEFEIRLDGNSRWLIGNGLPNLPTGIYPIASTDDAYNYDRNPHAIESFAMEFELPANPQIAAQPTCVDLGAVGVTIAGSVFFNALDARGEDAVAHEIQDLCDGHPESTGAYHYHSLSECLEGESTGEHSALYGYALDGFGIYGRYGENGDALTNDDLDECHGHTHEIEWDGQMVEMYHYHATWEYPYTIGCYRGTPVMGNFLAPGGDGQQGQGTSGNGGQTGGNTGQQPGGNPPGGGNPPPNPPPGGGGNPPPNPPPGG